MNISLISRHSGPDSQEYKICFVINTKALKVIKRKHTEKAVAKEVLDVIYQANVKMTEIVKARGEKPQQKAEAPKEGENKTETSKEAPKEAPKDAKASAPQAKQ
jgi:hypothetical protein